MTYTCHDCKKEIKIPKGEELIDGKFLKYTDDGVDYYIVKCSDCFKKDKSLRNYKECEVYSRIVGYLRPITSWNKGKQQEYKERKVFKTK